MPRAHPLQAAFNAGELSPRMAARVDFAKFPNGCARLENMLPLSQGGATRRPGTRYVATVKDSEQGVRLLGFEYSTEQAYVLEAGGGYFRFFKDKGRIEAASVGAAISNGDFTSNIAGWDDRSSGTGGISHDAANGRLNLDAAGSGNEGHAEQAVTTADSDALHVLRFRIFGAPGGTVKLRVGTTSTGAEVLADESYMTGSHCREFTPGASPFYVQFVCNADKTLQIDAVALIDGAPVEIGTPYEEAELLAIQSAQSADTMYLVHRDRPVHKLTRGGHSSWSLAEVAFFDGPYLDADPDSGITLQPNQTTGLGATLTASASLFAATDVGRLVRIKHGSSWGHAVITGFASATEVAADVKADFGATTASPEWQLGAWSDTTGYPCAVTFYEQRLCFGGSRDKPQSIWGSQIADFENMRPDNGTDAVEDDDAIAYTIAADQVNAVRWLSPGNDLMVGTTGGEWLMRATRLGEPITPSNLQVKRQTTHGSATVAPCRVGHAVLFVQRQARKVMEFAFNFEVDGFRAPDLTILADHVTGDGLVQMAYQHEPDSLLWCVRTDGTLAALTYRRDQDVVAWSRHSPGGQCDGGASRVESVSVIPGNGEDEVWIAVRRTIGGATRRYIEVIEPAYRSDSEQSEAFYVDSGLSYNGGPTNSVAGLDHLEGETVAVLADGAIHPSRIVAEGTINLAHAASRAQVGLPYVHVLESLRLEAGAAAGTALGQTKRVHGVTLVMLDSAAVEVGPDEGPVSAVPFRTVSHPMDAAVPLFSGERFVEFEGDYGSDARITIRGDAPAPFTLLAMAPRLKTNEAA